MLPSRRFLLLLPVLFAMSTGLASAQPLPPVTVTGEPVGPSPTREGTGLCSASFEWRRSPSELPQTRATFNTQLNAYLDENASSRLTSVVRTPLDLSNNNLDGARQSYGDFLRAVLGCSVSGCNFVYTGYTMSFVSRLRGLLDVTPDMVGKALHFGFYADDAVSLTFFDRAGKRYEVINRPVLLGHPTWRTTNSVTFSRPGLYPLEVLYSEISDHAALELSMREGPFTDFEDYVFSRSETNVNLADAGFQLVTPDMFHHTPSGAPTLEGSLDYCRQCERRYANLPGSEGCHPGHHCNAAALCEQCDTASFCGSSCSPCGASTPFCVYRSGEGYGCVECEGDADCSEGTCQAGVCTRPDAGGADAGSSPDASTPDAGGTGMDGGSSGSDGGTPDASTPDAGGDDGDAGSSTPDSGTPDGSTPGGDGGSTGGAPDAGPSADAGPGSGGDDGGPGPGAEPGGCGCGTSVPSLAPLSLLGLALLVRRARRARDFR